MTTPETATATEHTQDPRDTMADQAINALREEREQAKEAEEENQQANTPTPPPLNPEYARMLLSYSLGVIQLSVGAVFDVPFEIETEAGNQWLDASVPMMQKYGPQGLKWLEKYEDEIMFSMATFTLIGGCAVQVRRLRLEKAQPKENPDTPDAGGQDEVSAAPQ